MNKVGLIESYFKQSMIVWMKRVEEVEAEVIEDTAISNCEGSNVTLLKSFVKAQSSYSRNPHRCFKEKNPESITNYRTVSHVADCPTQWSGT